jgi:hypothetical protein
MPRRRGRFGVLQLLSLVIAVTLGLAIVGLKLGGPRALAQPATPKLPSAAAASARAPIKAAPSPSASASSSATSASAPTPSPSGSAAAGHPKSLDDTVVQTEEDIDKNLSEEQRASLGTGKVPIHREGPYRSPFAAPRAGGPVTVKVGTVLSFVRDYNIQTGQFEAGLFVSLTSVDKEMGDVQLVFTNGKEVDLQPLADTPTFKLYRVRGTFSGPVDLRRYPFDTQVLPIEIEDSVAGVDQLIFVPDPNRTSLDEGFSVAGWGIAHVGARAFKHRYTPRFDRDDLQVSRYKVEVGIDRFGVSAALSVFVPAFIIVIISLTGMWVPPHELEVRSNTGAPMLAAAVLFHYALLSTLPATGYLTRADKVMMGTYFCLLLNMLSTWTFLIVEEETQMKLFKFWRWVVPVGSTALMLAASIL